MRAQTSELAKGGEKVSFRELIVQKGAFGQSNLSSAPFKLLSDYEKPWVQPLNWLRKVAVHCRVHGGPLLRTELFHRPFKGQIPRNLGMGAEDVCPKSARVQGIMLFLCTQQAYWLGVALFCHLRFCDLPHSDLGAIRICDLRLRFCDCGTDGDMGQNLKIAIRTFFF